jgi:hypothetical protein
MKLFTNALLPTSSTAFKRVNVLFDERIVKISADEIATEEPPELIDLKGNILLPGAIDPHTHIIDSLNPGKDISRLSKAALAGGWTTLCELSYFDPQPIFEESDLKRAIRLINDSAYTDMALWGNVDIESHPYHAEAAQNLWARGVVGISLLTPSPNDAIPDLSFTEIMDLFIDIYESDTAFAFQGYDFEQGGTCGFASQLDAIKKILRRMQENPIHVPRVASWQTIEFINSISKRSDVSFSLCIADLMHLFGNAAQELDHDLAEGVEGLFELLRTNKIYLLSNNVRSHPLPRGVCGLFAGTGEQSLSHSYLWLLAELWKKRKVPLATVIKMTSENAAKRLGLYPVKGCLEAGSDADFVIYDPNGTSSFTLGDGRVLELPGAFPAVYLRGQKVVSDGKAGSRTGEFLPRHTNPKRRHTTTTWI